MCWIMSLALVLFTRARIITGQRILLFCGGTGSRWAHGTSLLELPRPYCDPVRDLLAHPVVVKYLNVMCGAGFRLDHGPQFNNAVKGTAGLVLHGAGEPHREYVAYHHQNGEMYCGGVTVTWNLTDCPAGKGDLLRCRVLISRNFGCRLAFATAMRIWVRLPIRGFEPGMCCFLWMGRKLTVRIRGKMTTTGGLFFLSTLPALLRDRVRRMRFVNLRYFGIGIL